MKFKISLSLILILFLSRAHIHARSNIDYSVDIKDILPKKNYVDVYINDEKLNFDKIPHTIKGYTMVQLRPIYERLGLTLLWNHKSKTITGIKDDINISIIIGDSIIRVNDKKLFSRIEPYTLDGDTMVPIRIIAESIGAVVNWDNTNKSVNIELED